MSSNHPASPAPVRVRFAPSPTGLLHIGAMRSAFFNWLWARHTGGTFVLRLEDTDRQRLVDGASEQIYASHDLLGITPDEGPIQGGDYGPYVQSQRLDLYRDHAERLLATGALYRCWCSPERLTGLREAAQARGEAFKYDRFCLDPQHQRDDSEPHVLRFRIPDQPAVVSYDDAVRGHLEVRIDTLDDFVALKADGYPTYHFANVVDDHLMAISHVLRADEWLPSTPKHLLLFAAFGWDPPLYAHLPAVQGATGGKKLSKRDGAKSIQQYVEEGYLPQALCSFLATLGWNDGTTDEIYNTATLIERFTLERIQKSPARFNLDRLTWVNGVIIRQLPLQELLTAVEEFWPTEAKDFSSAYRTAVLGLVQDRLKLLAELPELTSFFFTDPAPTVEALTKAYAPAEAARHLSRLAPILKDTTWNPPALEAAVREYVTAEALTPGQLFGLLRTSLTGRTAAPGLFDTMTVLGRDSTLRRLSTALELLATKI